MTVLTPAAPRTASTARPRRARRAALGGTTALAALLPTVWGLATVAELLTGTQTDHRFHQLTGQGLLLSALWLTPVALLARAGWRGERPSTAVGWQHLVLMATGAVAGLLVPAGGGLFAGGVAAVTGGLLWLALPLRPRLRVGGLDVVLAPLALLALALVVPYAVTELGLQGEMLDEHAELAHNYDMAWVVLTLGGMAVVAAASAAARRLATAAGAGLALVGAAAWALTDDTTWSVLAVLLGLALAGVGLARSAARSVPGL